MIIKLLIYFTIYMTIYLQPIFFAILFVHLDDILFSRAIAMSSGVILKSEESQVNISHAVAEKLGVSYNYKYLSGNVE